MEKQKRMMRTILHLYARAKQLVAASIPISTILATGLFDKIVKMKYDVPNNQLEKFDAYIQEIDTAMDAIVQA